MFIENYYEGQTFTDIELKKTHLNEIEFHDCKFVRCNLSESVLQSCTFKTCEFQDCDLSLVQVTHSVFKGVTFSHCKLIGVNWGLASWENRDSLQLLKPLAFKDCILNYSSFVGLVLEKAELINCVVHEVDFSEANLKSSDFSGSDFEKSIFRNTNLEEANFVKARNYFISPTLNQIKNAKFAMPEAITLLYSLEIDLQEYPAGDSDS